jgi:hypothetical protein
MLFSLGVLSQGKKIGTFTDDNFKIPILRVDDRKVYVVDQGRLKGFIYDRKTLAKKAEFGGKGEAPGEFLGISDAVIDEKYIYVSSAPDKLSIFSKEGKFIKDYRGPVKTGQFVPLGNNTYLATYYSYNPPGSMRIKLQYRLFDSNLKFKKEIFVSEFHCLSRYLNGKLLCYYPSDCFAAAVYNNNIYFGNTDKGFYFAVFNRDGNMLYEIKLNVPKRIISGREKDSMLSHMPKKPLTKEGVSFERENVIRDEVPAYKYFFVNDDRIYVFSYSINKVIDLYILDLKGNILKKRKMSLLDFGNYCLDLAYVDKGKLLFIQESPGVFDEDTELHEIDLMN